MEVRLTPAARSDIDLIWTYTQAQWGLVAAETYLADIGYGFERISEAPSISVSVAHVRLGYRKLIVRSHAIYYRVIDGYFSVVRVLHHSQDLHRQI